MGVKLDEVKAISEVRVDFNPNNGGLRVIVDNILDVDADSVSMQCHGQHATLTLTSREGKITERAYSMREAYLNMKSVARVRKRRARAWR